MSGLLEADIDLGLESGAAAFDPLYCSPPTHARTHHPPEQTELLHHRAYSTPTDIKRLVCSCSAQSSCPFHMSHLLASSPLRGSTLRPLRSPCQPYGDPFLPFSLLLARPADVSRNGSLARLQPVNALRVSPLNSPGIWCRPILVAPAFHPFPDHAPSFISLPFIPMLLAKNRNNSPFLNVPVLFHVSIAPTIRIEIAQGYIDSFEFLRRGSNFSSIYRSYDTFFDPWLKKLLCKLKN